MIFNILATLADFEADLIQMPTREGMTIARARGRLRGKPPKLKDHQAREIRRMRDAGHHSISKLAENSSASRSTVHHTLKRQPAAT